MEIKYVFDVVQWKLFRVMKKDDFVELIERTKKGITVDPNIKLKMRMTESDFLFFVACGIFQNSDREASNVDAFDEMELTINRSTREKYDEYVGNAIVKQSGKKNYVKFVLCERENEQ